MLKVTPGASFTVLLYKSTDYANLLFVFSNKSTEAKVRAIASATGDMPIVSVLEETSPDDPDPLSGEVLLSPSGEWRLKIYGQDSPTDLDETSAEPRDLLFEETAQVNRSCGDDTGYTPSTPSGYCQGVDILDQDGNVIAHINDGETYTVEPDMPFIAQTYSTEALAGADTTTVPLEGQAILVAGRLYHGDGVKTSAQLIAAKVYIPSFTEDSTNGVTVKLGTDTKAIQLNDPA